jgi:hypothetical protein
VIHRSLLLVGTLRAKGLLPSNDAARTCPPVPWLTPRTAPLILALGPSARGPSGPVFVCAESHTPQPEQHAHASHGKEWSVESVRQASTRARRLRALRHQAWQQPSRAHPCPCGRGQPHALAYQPNTFSSFHGPEGHSRPRRHLRRRAPRQPSRQPTLAQGPGLPITRIRRFKPFHSAFPCAACQRVSLQSTPAASHKPHAACCSAPARRASSLLNLHPYPTLITCASNHLSLPKRPPTCASRSWTWPTPRPGLTSPGALMTPSSLHGLYTSRLVGVATLLGADAVVESLRRAELGRDLCGEARGAAQPCGLRHVVGARAL